MSPITLMRKALLTPYSAARDAHPGLLAQRYYPEYDEDQPDLKAKHIVLLCHIPPSDFYRRAYARWVAATTDFTRFATTILRVETRLFIGLNGSNMLETGCALQHSYGMNISAQDPNFQIYLCIGQSNMEGAARAEK